MDAKRIVMLACLILPVLGACASSSESTVRHPPNYASLLGMEYYEVHCGASRVIVSYRAIDIFFTDDGAEKTRQEFCAQYRSDTLIRR